MVETEVQLSLEDDLLARTKKVAEELGIKESRLIEAAVLSCLSRAKPKNPDSDREA